MLTELTLPDGAVLEYAEYGDPAGIPVVFQPGTPATAAGGAIVDGAARRNGVRLVVVSRPGYGASTPTPPGLASVARQVGLLAEHLGLTRFGVWGLSGGGPSALAQAAATPDLVARAVVSAGPAPDAYGEETALTAEAVAMKERFAAMDPETFVAQVPPNERYFVDHPDDRPIFLADLRRALARPDGYVRDNLSWEEPWDVALAAVTVPVDLVYGEVDQMVNLDNGQRLAAALPHAQLHVLPGIGHGYATFGAADLVMELLAGLSHV